MPPNRADELKTLLMGSGPARPHLGLARFGRPCRRTAGCTANSSGWYAGADEAP